MITTKQLLELGFKQYKETSALVFEDYYYYKANLYNEDETIRYMVLTSSDSRNKDDNEWSVFVGTADVGLQLKDFEQLKTFVEIVKNNYIHYIPETKEDYDMRSTQLHYENGKGYDIIDVCKDYALNFNRGNVMKYVARAGKKQDELQDLRKALDYLQREIDYLESKQKEYIREVDGYHL